MKTKKKLLSVEAWLAAIICSQFAGVVEAKIFDSFMSYRQGSNAVVEDTAIW